MELFETSNETVILNLVLTKQVDAGIIRPFMFSTKAHSLIWESIEQIVTDSLTPEKILLVDYLAKKGKLTDSGGTTYIDYLCSLKFAEENAQVYIDKLVNEYKSRQFITILSEAQNNSLAGEEIESVSEKLTRELDQLNSLVETGKEETTTDSIDSAYNLVVQKTENPGIIGISTGLQDLDSFTGGQEQGDLWLLAARPSMGKTLVSLQIALKSKVPTLIFNLEMLKQPLIERMLASQSGISLKDIHLGRLEKRDLKKVKDAAEELKKLPIYLDTGFTPSLGYVTNKIKLFKNKYGIERVIVDYIGLFTTDSDNQVFALGELARSFKLLATKLEIGIILLSQLNRGLEGPERKDKRPLLSDLRQSGNLEEHADLAAFLYRDVVYNKDTKDKDILEMIVRKNRNGAIGTLLFKCDLETQSIERK